MNEQDSKAYAALELENARLRQAFAAIEKVIEDDATWYFASNFAEIYNIVARVRENRT